MRREVSGVREELSGKGFNILLEILASLGPPPLLGVPYTFRTRTAGESKLSGKIVFQYLEQLWRLSWMARLCSNRFSKFAIAAGVGVVVNLVVMTFLLKLAGLGPARFGHRQPSSQSK